MWHPANAVPAQNRMLLPGRSDSVHTCRCAAECSPKRDLPYSFGAISALPPLAARKQLIGKSGSKGQPLSRTDIVTRSRASGSVVESPGVRLSERVPRKLEGRLENTK